MVMIESLVGTHCFRSTLAAVKLRQRMFLPNRSPSYPNLAAFVNETEFIAMIELLVGTHCLCSTLAEVKSR